MVLSKTETCSTFLYSIKVLSDGIRRLYSNCSKQNGMNQNKNVIRAVGQAGRENVRVAKLLTVTL
jgi:hypothetical protein